jgi:hypothetical protein
MAWFGVPATSIASTCSSRLESGSIRPGTAAAIGPELCEACRRLLAPDGADARAAA